jgi:hypothetical protein
MRQDRVQAARVVNQAPLQTALFYEVIEFLDHPRFTEGLDEGLDIFWGGHYSVDVLSALQDDDKRRFIEWFIHDYRYGDERRYIIDLFIEREGHRLNEEARQLLDAWSASAMTLARHLRRTGDDRIAVYDPLRESEYEIASRLMATNGRPGDLLMGRLYELEGARHLSVTTLLLPAEYEQPLVEYVRNAYRICCDEHPGASWEQFLRRHGHMMNIFLLSDRAQALRALIGPGTRFYDPAATRDRMREIQRRIRQQGDDDELMTLDDLEPLLHMHHTAGGIVLPGHEEPEEDEPAQDAPPKRPTILLPGRDD